MRNKKMVIRVLVYSGEREEVDKVLECRQVRPYFQLGNGGDGTLVEVAELSLSELPAGTHVGVPIVRTPAPVAEQPHEVPSVRKWWKGAGR